MQLTFKKISPMLAVSVAALAIALVAGAQNKPGQPSREGPAVLVGQAEMLPEAPNFELKDLNGRTIRLSDFRGKAVLLNFWASFCEPCKQEMPWLIEFRKQYGPKGLVILGVSMDASAAAAKKFSAGMGVNYAILMGNQQLADTYWVKGLPVSIYIDRNGRMTDQVPGQTTRSFMENEIQLALTNARYPLKK